MGIDGNKTADRLARQGSSHPLPGPQPDFGISSVVTGVIRDWTGRKWRSTGSPLMDRGGLRAFLN